MDYLDNMEGRALEADEDAVVAVVNALRQYRRASATLIKTWRARRAAPVPMADMAVFWAEVLEVEGQDDAT